MDTYELPDDPEDLVAAVPCPVDRVVYISRRDGGNRFYLPHPYRALRLADWAQAIKRHTQTELVELTRLSRARVSQLTRKATARVSR